MQEKIKVPVTVSNRLFLWFIPYSASDSEVITYTNTGKYNVNLSHSFDYESFAKEDWLLHIDIGIDVLPLAKIKARTSFEAKCPKEHLFHPDVLPALNKIAMQSALRGFLEQSKVHNIATDFKEIEAIDEYAKQLTGPMIEMFHIRQSDRTKDPPPDQGGLNITRGNKTALSVMATFIILDEVLHTNKAFNLPHNQEVFHQIVPEPVYYTIKFHCIEIQNAKIHLVFMHSILFQVCLDCAIQMLLDKHAQTLQPALLESGLSPEKQDVFISFGSQMLLKIRDDDKKSGITITNLQQRHDWNSLIQ